MADSHELDATYRETSYWVLEGPKGKFAIHIGELSPEADAILQLESELEKNAEIMIADLLLPLSSQSSTPRLGERSVDSHKELVFVALRKGKRRFF
jgi:hypothetical protein